MTLSAEGPLAGAADDVTVGWCLRLVALDTENPPGVARRCGRFLRDSMQKLVLRRADRLDPTVTRDRARSVQRRDCPRTSLPRPLRRCPARIRRVSPAAPRRQNHRARSADMKSAGEHALSAPRVARARLPPLSSRSCCFVCARRPQRRRLGLPPRADLTTRGGRDLTAEPTVCVIWPAWPRRSRYVVHTFARSARWLRPRGRHASST